MEKKERKERSGAYFVRDALALASDAFVSIAVLRNISHNFRSFPAHRSLSALAVICV